MTKIEAHTDHGSVLKPNEAALIVDENDDMRLLLPDYGDDDEVPPRVMFLVAVSIKARDEEWIDEMLTEFEAAN